MLLMVIWLVVYASPFRQSPDDVSAAAYGTDRKLAAHSSLSDQS